VKWESFYEGKCRTLILIGQDFGSPPFGSITTSGQTDLRDQMFHWVLNKYRIQTESMAWLDDDCVPYVTPIGAGTWIFAEALGSDVVFMDNDTFFARPVMKIPRRKQRGIFVREEKVLRTFLILHRGSATPPSLA
jgi:hypothetical protein